MQFYMSVTLQGKMEAWIGTLLAYASPELKK